MWVGPLDLTEEWGMGGGEKARGSKKNFTIQLMTDQAERVITRRTGGVAVRKTLSDHRLLL